MRRISKFLPVLFLFVVISMPAFAQYPGDIQDQLNSEKGTRYSAVILTTSEASRFSADSNEYKLHKFTNTVLARWPIFKERSKLFISEFIKTLEIVFSESRIKFLTNLSKLSKNTLFLSDFEIQGNSLVSKDQALNASGLTFGKWIWEVNLGRTEKRLKQLAWVKSASSHVGIFPVSMKVVVEEYSPWILSEFGRRLWVVSENGALLSPVAEVKNIETLRSLRSLPRLVGLSDDSKWADETYLKSENARYHHAVSSIRFIDQAGGLPFRAGIIQLLSDGSLEITPAERSKRLPVVIIQVSNQEQASEKIKVLNKVLLDLEFKNELSKKIDLRYENRAVVS